MGQVFTTAPGARRVKPQREQMKGQNHLLRAILNMSHMFWNAHVQGNMWAERRGNYV